MHMGRRRKKHLKKNCIARAAIRTKTAWVNTDNLESVGMVKISDLLSSSILLTV